MLTTNLDLKTCLFRLGEVTLERDQLVREKEKGRDGRWESQCQRYLPYFFVVVLILELFI